MSRVLKASRIEALENTAAVAIAPVPLVEPDGALARCACTTQPTHGCLLLTRGGPVTFVAP